MEFRILGPLEVLRDGEIVTPAAPKQRALLIRLLLQPNEVISAERLVADLWGEDAPAKAVGTLQFHVSKLRSALEPGRAKGKEPTILLTRKPGYLLAAQPEDIDLARFESLMATAREAEPAEAADLYRQALALHRGPPLVDVTYEAFAQADIQRITEEAQVALEHRIDADLADGRAVELLPELEGLVAEHPLREGLWAQYMTSLYQAGRQAEALRAYREAERVLGEELGIEPGPALRALEEQILLQDPGLGAAPPRQLARPGNLPAQPSTFVGRRDERVTVDRLVHETRLLTLVGAGGTGKTRLALHAAEDLDEFGEAWLIKLGPISDPELVAHTAATALGVTDRSDDPLEATVEALRAKHALAIVDNCEHVLEGAARFVAALLERCPSLTIIATSREPLGTAGETTYGVPPLRLDTADGESEAARLFRERAGAARPDLDELPTATVEEICRSLDGIPLAIELAAAKLRVMSLDEIHARLDDRLRLLTGGNRAALPHQQTLAATIEWSYDLLTEAQQDLFSRLAVFRGGWESDAATAIAGRNPEVLDHLGALIDKSLVVAETPASGPSRYWMLETLRQFALEHLSDADAARRAHATYMAELVEEAERQLRGPEEVDWMDRLDRETDNIRAAVAWALQKSPEDALRIVGPLKLFIMAREHVGNEAVAWLDHALAAAPEADLAVRARALSTAGGLAWASGRLDQAETYHTAALEAARELDDREQEFRALNDLGLVALDRNEHRVARRHFEQSLEVARHQDDPGQVASALTRLGQAASRDRQRSILEEALAMHRHVGRSSGVAQVLLQLGWLDLAEASPEAAASKFTASETEWRRIRQDIAASVAMCGRADALTDLGDMEGAEAVLTEAQHMAEWAGSAHAAGLAAYRLANVERIMGRLDAAEARLETAITDWKGSTFQPSRGAILGYAAAIASDRGHHDDAMVYCAQGKEIWLECRRHAGTAWIEGIRALVLLQAGEPHQAVEVARAALRLYASAVNEPVMVDGWLCPEVGTAVDHAECLDVAGQAMVATGDESFGTEVRSAARAFRTEHGLGQPDGAPLTDTPLSLEAATALVIGESPAD